MLSKKIEDGYVGVSNNFDKTHVLLQITKDKEQVRIKLTTKEALDLIEEITTNVNIVKSKKDTLENKNTSFNCNTIEKTINEQENKPILVDIYKKN